MQEQSECSICWEVLSNPRILPCHHGFCARCLQELVDHFDPILIWLFRGFPCPLCRTQVRLPADIAQAFPRYAEMPDELANIRIEEVSSNDEAQGLPRRIEVVNRPASRRVAPKERCSPGYFCLAFVVLVIAFLVYTCAQYAAQMDEKRGLHMKQGYELSEKRLKEQIKDLIDARKDDAEKAEEACSSEKEGYTISEKRLRRQVQDLIDKEKRDSLQIERMQKYIVRKDEAEEAEKYYLSELEECKISEQRLKRQVQDLMTQNIANKKRDSLLIERMEIYIDMFRYTSHPVLSKTFHLEPAESRGAVALTLIDGKLLVANSENGNLKLRDAYSDTKESDWATIPSSAVAGMGLCLKNGEVIVSTWNKFIFRFNGKGEILGQWPVETTAPGVISVTDDHCNVVLAVRDSSRKILTYSNYGELISEVEMKANILESRLIKAVQLSNGHYLVSYGVGDDPVHGIDIIDANGQTLRSHSWRKGWRKGSGTGQFRDPRDFVVDGYGNVLVADSDNGRVVLLDSQLKFQREIISTELGLKHPLGIVLNERETLLYVADNKWDPSRRNWTDGKIKVFKIR